MCSFCGYETELKYIMKRHLQRKNPCNAVLQDIDCAILLQQLDSLPQQKDNRVHKCKYCNKHFTASSNMYRHQKM